MSKTTPLGLPALSSVNGIEVDWLALIGPMNCRWLVASESGNGLIVTLDGVVPQLPGPGVGVGDGLGVGEAVGLGVGVGDAVGLGDGVGEAVGVGVGDGVAPQSTTTMALLPDGMTPTTGQACPPFC